MGSFKDRGGKAALNNTGGAVMDFLPLETIILSVASTTGQLGKLLCEATGTSRLENSESGLCPSDINDSTGIQPTEST